MFKHIKVKIQDLFSVLTTLLIVLLVMIMLLVIKKVLDLYVIHTDTNKFYVQNNVQYDSSGLEIKPKDDQVQELLVVLHSLASNASHILQSMQYCILPTPKNTYVFIPNAPNLYYEKRKTILKAIRKLRKDREKKTSFFSPFVHIKNYIYDNINATLISINKRKIISDKIASYQWFDLNINPHLNDNSNKNSYENKDITKNDISLEQATINLEKVINNKIKQIEKKYKVSSNFSITVLGYSQGGITSINLGKRGKIKQIKQIISISSPSYRFINQKDLETKNNNNISFHLLHGKQDSIVPINNMFELKNSLIKQGFKKINIHKIDSMVHSPRNQNAQNIIKNLLHNNENTIKHVARLSNVMQIC